MRIAVVATAICLSVVGFAVAEDATAAIRKTTNIPAEGLAPALATLAKEFDFQVLYRTEIVEKLHTQGVSGAMTAAEALERVLSGTGLTYRYLDDKTITILPAGSLFTDEATATATGGDPNGASSSAQEGKRSSSGGFRVAQMDQGANSQSSTVGNSTSPAPAPTVPPAERPVGALEEIVVTARKREENAQDVPLSLTVLTEAALSKIGFKSITDLKEKVAALDITPDNNTPSEMAVFIRGVGATDAEQLTRDNGVGVYLDDVYVGHGMMLASQLLDIERIEVLPGPQGTLYGRNTVGGAVKFISEKPTGTFDVKDSLDVGNFGYVNEYASVNLPRTAAISVKLSGLVSHIDGWVKNTGTAGDYGRKDSTGGRGAIRWTPAENLTVDYVIDHNDSHGTPDYLQFQYPDNYFGFFIRPAVPDRQNQTWRPVNLPQNDRFIGTGNSLTAVWDFAEHVSLKSISAYREFDSGFFNDTVEGFNFAYVQAITTKQHQFSQELLLTGSTAASQVNYHLGLFYFTEAGRQYSYLANDFATLTVAVPYVPPTLADVSLNCICVVHNWSKAVYGEVTWVLPILDQRLSIDVGARSSSDTRGVSRFRPNSIAPIPVYDANEASYRSFDPALTIDYKLTPSAHIYGKIAKAYQAGGFDAFNNDYARPFGPEHVTSFEVGLKSELLQRRLLLNADVFDERYRDIQELFYDPVFNGGAQETVNAGRATLKGFEAQVEIVPVAALDLNAQITHLETRATVTNPYDLVTTTGGLPNSPKWKGSLSANYTFAPFQLGQLSAFAVYSYNARQLLIGEPQLDYRPSYPLLDARISLSDIDVGIGKLVVSVWGKNLTDKAYQTFRQYGGVQFGLPRNYGINFTYRFPGAQ